MNTNLQNVPVGTRIVSTNEDGTVTITTLTSRQTYDLRIYGLLILGIGLIIVLFWLVGRKKSY